MTSDRSWLKVSSEVSAALAERSPVVALESTLLTHGLPRPRNLEVGQELEALVRKASGTPATIAVIDGIPTVGLTQAELEYVATENSVVKLSTRDLPIAIARRLTGGTTVAATSFLASRAGISVFATGGIGGVHRGAPLDVSADLTELHRTSIIVVCAGAKSILDLPVTREMLETLGVLVLGWRTDSFPGFYTRETGLPVDLRVENSSEVVRIWKEHQRISAPGAILVCAPVPEPYQLAPEFVEEVTNRALAAAREARIQGKAVTPYLLTQMSSATQGTTLESNVALLRNNVTVAADIARELSL